VSRLDELSDGRVLELLDLRKAKVPLGVIGRMFGVSGMTVSNWVRKIKRELEESER